jgi:hypothetical protein
LATTPDKVLETLKMQAWERAKGELLSLLHTYHSEGDPKVAANFKRAKEKIDAFIVDFEGWCC